MRSCSTIYNTLIFERAPDLGTRENIRVSVDYSSKEWLNKDMYGFVRRMQAWVLAGIRDSGRFVLHIYSTL